MIDKEIGQGRMILARVEIPIVLVESIRERQPVQISYHILYSTNNHPTNLHQAK